MFAELKVLLCVGSLKSVNRMALCSRYLHAISSWMGNGVDALL